MPLYRHRFECAATVEASVDEVWAYLDDRQAQMDLDPRIHRLDTVEGEWGAAGSRMVCTGTLPSGATHTWEQELVEVHRPHRYVTRTPFPDGVTLATHEFRAVDGGTEWRHTIEVTTRRLSLAEYVALWLSRRQRVRDFERNQEHDLAALRHALVAMRER